MIALSKLSYKVTEKGLFFSAALELTEEAEKTIDSANQSTSREGFCCESYSHADLM